MALDLQKLCMNSTLFHGLEKDISSMSVNGCFGVGEIHRSEGTLFTITTSLYLLLVHAGGEEIINIKII